MQWGGFRLWKYEVVQSPWNTVWQAYKKTNIGLTYDPARK